MKNQAFEIETSQQYHEYMKGSIEQMSPEECEQNFQSLDKFLKEFFNSENFHDKVMTFDIEKRHKYSDFVLTLLDLSAKAPILGHLFLKNCINKLVGT